MLDVQNRILQRLNNILRIGQTETQRRLYPQHISKSTALTEQQSSLPSQLHQLVCLLLARLLGLLVLDQLETDHETLTADVTDDPVLLLQVSQLSQQVISHFFCILVQSLSSDGVEDLYSHPALYVSSSKGIEKDVLDLVSDFLAGDHSANRKTVSYSLGHGDDVRFDALPSVTPILGPHPAETGLNLVTNDQTTVFVANQIDHLGQISLGEGIDASDALNTLKDKSRDLSSSVGIEGLLGISHQLFSCPLTAPVGAGPCQFFKLKPTLHGRVPCPNIGNITSPADQSMVSVPQRQKLVLVGVQAGEKDSEIIGLTSRVAQIDTVIPLTQFLAESLRVLRLPLREVDR